MAKGTNDLDEVLGRFCCGLSFAIHVIANVVFHEFGHEAVDGSARGGEALEHVGARRRRERRESRWWSIVQSWITDRPGILWKSRRFSVATS